MTNRRFAAFAAALVFSSILAAAPSQAVQVWSGRTYTFTKAASADWTLPENQDRITSSVWITRAGTQGIFNIAVESSYGSLSPADTEWATGDAADWQSLTFTPWVTWAGSNPPGTVGLDAVVHLISDDIYIDIRFDSWGIGGDGGGSFSYARGESAVPVPDAVPSPEMTLAATPNPFNPRVTLSLDLPRAGRAQLAILDAQGRAIRSFAATELGAGAHTWVWDGADDAGRAMPAGVYFAQATGDAGVVSQKLTLVK